jgi:excisionase family DNA binding protein
MNRDQPERLSVSQAAERLGIASHTLRTWLRERRLAHFRCGRRVVIDSQDVENFLRAHRIDAEQPA